MKYELQLIDVGRLSFSGITYVFADTQKELWSKVDSIVAQHLHSKQFTMRGNLKIKKNVLLRGECSVIVNEVRKVGNIIVSLVKNKKRSNHYEKN